MPPQWFVLGKLHHEGLWGRRVVLQHPFSMYALIVEMFALHPWKSFE